MPSKLIRDALLGQAPVLSKVALGYTNNELIGEKLFPRVQVDSKRVTVPEWGKGHLRIYNTERAPRADVKVIQPDALSTTDVQLEEHTFDMPLDNGEIEEAKRTLPDYLQHHLEVAMDTLLLEREYLIANMVQNTANMASGHYATLVGTDQFSHASSTPNNTIDAGITQLKSKGVKANTIIFGAAAWLKYITHADIISALFGTGARRPITEELIADYWRRNGNPFNVYVGESFLEDTSNTMVDLWSDNVIIARVPQSAPDRRSQWSPSCGYSFVYGPPEGAIDVRQSEDKKNTIIQPTLWSKVALMQTNAIYLINDTNA